MMKLSTIIETMFSTGCSSEQIIAVVRASEADAPPAVSDRRAKDAARKRRSRAAIKARGRAAGYENGSGREPFLSIPADAEDASDFAAPAMSHHVTVTSRDVHPQHVTAAVPIEAKNDEIRPRASMIVRGQSADECGASAMSRGQSVTCYADLFPDKESPHTPKEINPYPSISLRSIESRKRASEFETCFWPAWPNKVGKLTAAKAFARARHSHDLETILDGIERYVADKPLDRAWLNPATFLNQERFLDQPARAGPHERKMSFTDIGMMDRYEQDSDTRYLSAAVTA